MVGDPLLFAGDRLLHADGGLSRHRSSRQQNPRARIHRYAGMTIGGRKRAKPARSLWVWQRGYYAACLCIAPDADADPRIALTERSIAAHSRPISAAARPSA